MLLESNANVMRVDDDSVLHDRSEGSESEDGCPRCIGYEVVSSIYICSIVAMVFLFCCVACLVLIVF